MTTPFNRKFTFYTAPKPGFGSNGRPLDVEASSRVVRGTIQSVTGEEALAISQGNRNTGVVKVYASERLIARAQLSDTQGWVVSAAGRVYELTEELPFQNLGPIRHWKYIASEVPAAQIPDFLKGGA